MQITGKTLRWWREGIKDMWNVVAVAGGLAASLAWDTPAGPSIVAAATAIFFATLPGGRRA